jgi:hypothetical protein
MGCVSSKKETFVIPKNNDLALFFDHMNSLMHHHGLDEGSIADLEEEQNDLDEEPNQPEPLNAEQPNQPEPLNAEQPNEEEAPNHLVAPNEENLPNQVVHQNPFEWFPRAWSQQG